MTDTLARQLATHCASLSLETVDTETVTYTKQLLLDTLGTAIGGHRWSDSADVMIETARSLHGGETTARRRSTVLATGERLSPAGAALANGALSHSLDYDNRHSAGSLHVGSSVISAALAAGEVADTDGDRILEAILAGYDVATRLGMACNPRSSHERGFHPTGTCGSFGATAAVGVVRDFSVDEYVAAFGVNGSQASGGYQCSLTGGLNKRIHPGLAARDAFTSAAFVANGFEGPEAPIEGELGFLQAYSDDPRPERATEALGERYEAARTKIKPFPVGTFAHVPIALLTELRDEKRLDTSEIEQITITLPTSGAEMFGRGPNHAHPTSSADAQFDMPFAAALALTEDQVSIETFNETIETDNTREFARLMDITRTVGSAELESSLPELYPAEVTVETGDAEYERFRDWVAGEPAHPLSWEELTKKFAGLAPEFEDDTCAAIVEQVKTLETRSLKDVIGFIPSRPD